jgi:hypothetical protein
VLEQRSPDQAIFSPRGLGYLLRTPCLDAWVRHAGARCFTICSVSASRRPVHSSSLRGIGLLGLPR